MAKPGLTAEKLMAGYTVYMTEWEVTDRELQRTPMWRFIKWHRLLNKLHRLTKEFTANYLEEDPDGHS